MNFFTKNFNKDEFVAPQIQLRKLFKDYELLKNLQTKYYPLLHFGNQLVLKDEEEKIEFEILKKEYMQELKSVKNYKFKDNKNIDELLSLSEEELFLYVENYKKIIDEKYNKFLDENENVLYHMILGNAISKKQSSVFEEFDADIEKITYANFINTQEYFYFLIELVECKNNKSQIKQVFSKYKIEENIADEFFINYQVFFEKWKREKNQSGISLIEDENFYQQNGEEMSREFKKLLDDLLLLNDNEYQKLRKLYKQNKE